MNSSQWIVLIFGILYFGFILFTRRKGNFEEYTVASRGLGFFLIFSSLCASFIGPGWSMGLVREGFTTGMFMTYLLPFCGLGLIIVGVFLVPRIRDKFAAIYSIGDLVGGVNGHNHRFVRLATGIFSPLFFGSITVAMSYAGGELVNNVFGFSKTWSIVIVTSIVICYSYFGGIRATIETDSIQFVHFVILIPVLTFLILNDEQFDWTEYIEVTSANTTREFGRHPIIGIFSLGLLWLLSSTGLDSGGLGRFLASKSNKVARNATIATGIFMAVWLVLMVFIGSTGYYLYPDLGNNDQVLLHIASEHFPGVLYGIFIIAMIGVVMSSQDTVLNAGSILFSEDIMGTMKQMTEKQKLRAAKLYTVLMGIICIVVASYLSSILEVIMIIVEFYIPIMIPVIVFSVLKKDLHWQAALASMLIGFISYLIWKQYFGSIMPELVVALTLSILSYLTTDYILTRKVKLKS